jgi:hypothetical protein
MVLTSDGGGTGLWTDDELAEPEQLAQVTEQVQEVVVEARWAAGLPQPGRPAVAPRRPPARGAAARFARRVGLCRGRGGLLRGRSLGG